MFGKTLVEAYNHSAAQRQLVVATKTIQWWHRYLAELRCTVLCVEQTREAEAIYCRCLDELWEAQQRVEKCS